MANINYCKVILAGKLTADPELKTTSTGKAVVNFTVAVNMGKDKTTGSSKAEFFEVVAWENRAEFVTRYFHKGSSILLDGILQNRTWNDKDGNRRKVTEIIANDIRFADSKNEIPGMQQEAAYVPSSYTVPPEGPAPAPKMEEVDEGDDLPF